MSLSRSATIGRPTVNLEPFRLQIEQWKYSERLSAKAILNSLQNELNIKVSRTTLYRHIQQWASESPQDYIQDLHPQRTQDSEQLRQRIRTLFFEQVLNDRFMLLRLQTEGFTITKTGLQRIRRDLGLWRRQTPEMSAAIKTELYNFFENENELHTKLQTFGRTYLYVYVRQNQFVLSRKALYSCYRDFMPTNVTDRWHEMKHRRMGWASAGPDFIWSLDAYDKLKAWGIEIYAAIDTYSRYITTHNEKIESWWLRLSKGRARFWRDYFSIITAEGHFSTDCLSDRIAILYLYMPIIRYKLIEFVSIWNAHYIRKQANRPHVNPGQPWNLYFQPEATDAKSYAEAIPMDRLRTLLNIFKDDSIDLEAYLPQDIITVCNTILKGHDFPNDSPMQPKYSVYLFLRAQLNNHIALMKEPFIGLLDIPTGGIDRVRDHLAIYDIDVNTLEDITSDPDSWEAFDHRV
ncbi:unnamed protein product [Fusarium graminearum]|nr:unnamed protein product [Fusarium graminearum]